MAHVRTARTRLRGTAAAFGLAALMTVASAQLGVLAAQAGKMPMATKDTGSRASQDPHMRDMMGAPLPFGIMIGRAEQWMVGYQYMYESQSGMLNGTSTVSEASVLSRFATTPTDMTMKTHMGMVMFAPSDRFTVMAMLPYVSMSMGELHRDGTRSTERSAAIGDIEIRGLYSLAAAKDLGHRFLANVGVGLPTGSVNQRDAEGSRLEYPMQTGSGTYSVLPGVTYLGQALPWSWGAEFNSTVRFGTNEHGYRQGNHYDPSVWLARTLNSWVSVSAGASGEVRENIHGSDAVLDASDEPTKDPNLQGGKRLNALLGITVNPPTGVFKGQQFLVQGDVPAVQSLDGPQLKRSYMLHVAWQLGF